MDDDDLLPPQREFKSNADFRQMLQTSRPQRAEDGDLHFLPPYYCLTFQPFVLNVCYTRSCDRC